MRPRGFAGTGPGCGLGAGSAREREAGRADFLVGPKEQCEFESFFVFVFPVKVLFPGKWINGLKKIEKRIFLWVKFTKLRLFFRCVFKVVIFIIKFEPTGEFNFEKWICF